MKEKNIYRSGPPNWIEKKYRSNISKRKIEDDIFKEVKNDLYKISLSDNWFIYLLWKYIAYVKGNKIPGKLMVHKTFSLPIFYLNKILFLNKL